MTEQEKISAMWEIVRLAKNLAKENDPVLDGDIQIVLAMMVYKLKYMDPWNAIENIVEYE